MDKQTLTVTVSEVGPEPLQLQVTYFKPKQESKHCKVFFCLPGGSASASFFDLGTFADVDYSFASRMTELGHHVITMDHPGTSDNPLPESFPFIQPRQAADYIEAALSHTLQEFSLRQYPKIGIGHSMGGMTTTLIQARHKPFTAIGLFGSSAGGLDWGLTDEEKAYIEKPDTFARDLEKLTLAKFQTPFPVVAGGPSGKSITFGGETPELTDRLRDISCALYAAGGMMSMTRGSFRKEVEAIDVPIFFAFGDHDIGIPPEDAPKDYIKAPLTELIVLHNTGHNSFAFSSIEYLCTSLDHFVSEFKS